MISNLLRKKYSILFLLFTILVFTTACGADKKVSSLIVNAVTEADNSLKSSIDEKHKATSDEIKKIRDAEALVKKVGSTYKLITKAENAGPFEDMATALGAKAEYLETGNKDAYNTFNNLYTKSRTELLKFSYDLKEKGL